MSERLDAVWVVRTPEGEVTRITHDQKEATYTRYPSRYNIERHSIATPEMVALCDAVLVYLTSLDHCDDHGYDEMVAAGQRFREVRNAK